MSRRYFTLLLLSYCCLIILLTSCSVSHTTSVSRRTPPRTPPLGTTLYHGHLNGVTMVAWSPDGKRIASASYDKTVQVWDPVTGHLFALYRGHTDWVSAIAWSPDGKYLASASF